MDLCQNTKKFIKDNIYSTLTEEEKKKEIWSTDFTEEKVGGKRIYTCGIKSINSKVMVVLKISTKLSLKLAIETLWRSIKTEICSVRNYTLEEYTMIIHYFRDYSNYRRHHSSLNYEAPINMNIYNCN